MKINLVHIQMENNKCSSPLIDNENGPNAKRKSPTQTFTGFQTFLKNLQWEGLVFTKGVISASIASVVSVICTQPLDVLRPRYYSLMHCNRSTLLIRLKVFNEIWKIYKSEGFSKLYTGHWAAQRESVMQTVSMFYAQERIHRQMETTKHKSCAFVSGFLAGAITSIIQNPYNAYRAEMRRRKYVIEKHGAMNAAYHSRHNRAFPMLFRGCFPYLMHRGIQYGSRFWLYHVIRDGILRRKKSLPAEDTEETDLIHLTYFESFLAGAASGIFGDLISNPLDAVADQLQRNSLYHQRFPFRDTCRHYQQCLRLILSKFILKGSYAGTAPLLLKSMVSVAIQFTVYEKLQALMENEHVENENVEKDD